MTLSTSSNFEKPDDAFRAIVEAHRGLSEAQSADLDAALVSEAGIESGKDLRNFAGAGVTMLIVDDGRALTSWLPEAR